MFPESHAYPGCAGEGMPPSRWQASPANGSENGGNVGLGIYNEAQRKISLRRGRDIVTDVTSILFDIEQGDPQAAEQLLPLVYDELRKLAAAKMAREAPGQTLQPTALVHEAYLRLVDVEKAQHWNSRGHFFAAAAEAMRRILVENARRRSSPKRGGDWERQNGSTSQIVAPQVCGNLIALDEALDKLANEDPPSAELVKLRYFAGLTVKQAAKILDVSPRQADFMWSYARAWLRREIDKE
jgi:RNA polymerase sigma factor (TIGR02999 family)